MDILMLACLIFNVFVVAYLSVKRWRVASLSYALAFLLLLGLLFFSHDIPYVTDGMKEIFTPQIYALIRQELEFYMAYAVTPFFALELLTLIAAIVVTIATTERILTYCLKKTAEAYRRSCRVRPTRVRPIVAAPIPKRYLFFCSMLC